MKDYSKIYPILKEKNDFIMKRHRNMFFSLLKATLGMLLLFQNQAYAQLADLDLLEADDRSFGASVSASDDSSTGAAILLLPLSRNLGHLQFQGGAGSYATYSFLSDENATAIQWRVQGGPHWGKVGMQFYAEGVTERGIDYAGFIRFGEFDIDRLLLSGGIGTLIRADTETELGTGIERNTGNASDTKVKGLLLAAAEIDTPLFDSLRVLSTLMPGDETDFGMQLQTSYALGRIRIAAFGQFGKESGDWTKRYTGLVQVPF